MNMRALPESMCSVDKPLDGRSQRFSTISNAVAETQTLSADSRWDYRVILVFKSSTVATSSNLGANP
jgi:hypothetical protein